MHERMSHGKGVKGPKEKKKVPGWSIEETKEKRRSTSQDEMDRCWRNLTERMEEEVLEKYKVEQSKREASGGRSAPLEWRRVRKKQEI